MGYRILTRDEHFAGPGPKRILALDGGGLRGILALGFVARIEEILRERHGGDPDFRLCHYFDLMAGTSTGAIIAAALARGMSTAEVVREYTTLGREVFKRSFWRKGVLLARYDEGRLSARLREVLGPDTRLGDDSLRTGLLVVTKRVETGSPWPIGNNPRGKFFRAPSGADWVANAELPLWQVVRASTAAPSFFDPEEIPIGTGAGHQPVVGTFVDGGVSPFNNPALQALMYATLEGYRVGWKTGADALQIVSVGTGSATPGRPPARVAALGAVHALLSLMDDCAALVQILMQWMSSSRTSHVFDLEVGDLRADLLGDRALFSYLRYDLTLDRASVDALLPGLGDEELASLSAMDDPDNLEVLRTLGERAAAKQVRAEDFAPGFDLRASAPAAGGSHR